MGLLFSSDIIILKMEYKHLSQEELDILGKLVTSGQIEVHDLPKGMYIGLDSMGPVRDSKTDTLFEGIPQVLNDFTSTLWDHNLALVVATNGPDLEGIDILNSLVVDAPAFAVTEGGGKIVYNTLVGLDEKTLAHPEELEALKTLEGRVKHDPVMKMLLENTEFNDEVALLLTLIDLIP